MKVLYDSVIFSQSYGGISKYFFELNRSIGLEGCCTEISGLIKLNEYHSSANYLFSLRFIRKYNIVGIGRIVALATKLNKLHTLLLIKRSTCDLFHSTYYDNYFFIHLKIPLVITIHDLIPELMDNYPNRYEVIAKKKMLIERADAIIAISNSTKTDLLNFYNLDEKIVSVVYHGHRELNEKKVNFNEKFGEYILFVGKRDGYKNFLTFIKSVKTILEEFSHLNVVCTGNKFTENEVNLLQSLNIYQRFSNIFLEEVEMPSVYSCASVFVFPSLYEGFGMPILESFSNGCAVCLSDIACFHEIAEDGAIYFNPYCEISISNAVREVLINEERKKKLVDKGHERLKFFSWQRAATETLEVYRKVVK